MCVCVCVCVCVYVCLCICVCVCLCLWHAPYCLCWSRHGSSRQVSDPDQPRSAQSCHNRETKIIRVVVIRVVIIININILAGVGVVIIITIISIITMITIQLNRDGSLVWLTAFPLYHPTLPTYCMLYIMALNVNTYMLYLFIVLSFVASYPSYLYCAWGMG